MLARMMCASPRAENPVEVRCACGYPKVLGSIANAGVFRHLLGCVHSGGAVRRHNMLRDALNDLLRLAGYITMVECPLEVRTGKDEGLRIDILAYPPNGAPLLVDLTVYNSAAVSAEEKDIMRELEKKEESKVEKYEAAAEGLGGSVMPLAMDVWGSTTAETRAFLQSLVGEMKLRNVDEEKKISFNATVIPALSRALALGNGLCLLLSNKLPALGIAIYGDGEEKTSKQPSV